MLVKLKVKRLEVAASFNVKEVLKYTMKNVDELEILPMLSPPRF